ncbi:MAG: acyl carrier protein [Abitibacteriaceae bacterium]|nr:acyl carrier protein [Abditibacteriaceae bacterium]MBV9864547.1 acyl carrier protein [Abditibacteriaceae bacterium]
MLTRSEVMYTEEIREILAKHARLAVDVKELADNSNLYQAGLTSLTTVNLMLAIEDHFDIEFPDSLLGRNTFGSIEAISEAVEEVLNS